MTLEHAIKGKHGDMIYPTIEECVAAAVTDTFVQRFGHTNIYQDPETGGYYENSAAMFSVISLMDGTSPVYEPMASIDRNGTITPREKRLQPGDLEFSRGIVYQVIGIGDPQYGVYQTRRIKQGVRMPSFLKECREGGYAIVSKDAEKRNVVARKPKE